MKLHKIGRWALSFLILLNGVTAEAEKIVEIQVQGNGKVESEAILTILKTQKDQEFDPKTIRDDINDLHELGYFSDIRFYKEPADGGVRLIVEVKEKPSITSIKFSGLNELSEDDFKDKLETKLFTIVNESTITDDLRTIEKQYLEKGFYMARATYRLEESPENKMEATLVYEIDEGGKVQVGDVFIVGNEYFTDAELIGKFASQPVTRSAGLSSTGGVYNDEFVKRDADFLSYQYKDWGFAEVKVANPVSIMDRDKEYVRITMEVEEGIQYNVGSIDISGDILYPKEDLISWMKLKPEKLFRFSQFRADVEMLIDKYGDKGYAFVDVNPVHKFDREKKLVHLNYQITKGDKVYFGNMSIVGNSKTRDNVVRREMDVADSELYSGTRLTKSKRNIERLGFFEEVQTIKQRDTKDPSLLHYKFKVKEKPTGQLQAAVGFNPGTRRTSESSWFGQGRYSEDNQSGLGWRTNVTAQWNGGRNYSLEMGLTNPRVNDSKWSLGLTSFFRHEVRDISDDIAVEERRIGGSVTVGRQILENVRAAVTYKLTKITQNAESFLLDRFREQGIESSMIFAVTRDTTNNYLDPSEGSIARISQQVTGGPLLKGDQRYMETELSGSYYYPIDFTETYRTYFKLHGALSILEQNGDYPIPFYTRYRLGGPEDMRGYKFKTLGPRFTILQAPGDAGRSINKGGTKQLLMQGEYFFPIIPDANIKGLVFADGGRVYDDNERVEWGNFKRDVGFGFRWITPIAPFRFEWAYPIVDGKVGKEFEFILYLGY